MRSKGIFSNKNTGKYSLVIAIFLLLAFQFGCDRNEGKDKISVVINEERLVSDVDPIVVNERTMLPMRAVLEGIGAKVEWANEIQTAIAIKGQTEVRLREGSEYATVNGEDIWLDSPVVSISGRMFVPVRFVAETFDMDVSWDNEKRIVTIEDKKYEMIKSGRVNAGRGSFYIGQSEDELISSMGSPNRKDRSEKGFLWYIYNDDYSRYVQVGVEDGKVVAIYTNSNDLEYDGRVRFGMMSPNIEAEFPDGRSFFDGKYDIYVEDQVLTLFVDVHESNTVTALLLMDEDVHSRKDSKYSIDIKNANERQLLDLSNGVRSRYGLNYFVWSEEIAAVARAHSEDMSERNYFSHENPDGQSPFDRIESGGILYMSAAENIAAGYPNAIYAHEAWMNSGSHREAILSEIERFGAGIAQNDEGYIYFAENFYTPR